MPTPRPSSARHFRQLAPAQLARIHELARSAEAYLHDRDRALADQMRGVLAQIPKPPNGAAPSHWARWCIESCESGWPRRAEEVMTEVSQSGYCSRKDQVLALLDELAKLVGLEGLGPRTWPLLSNLTSHPLLARRAGRVLDTLLETYGWDLVERLAEALRDYQDNVRWLTGDSPGSRDRRFVRVPMPNGLVGIRLVGWSLAQRLEDASLLMALGFYPDPREPGLYVARYHDRLAARLKGVTGIHVRPPGPDGIEACSCEQLVDRLRGLRRSLFPFQVEGVQFLEQMRGRAVLADEMGLGKTIQAIAWLHLHPEARPAVIVCPAVVRGNWEKELRDWLPKRRENEFTVIRTRGGEADPRGITLVSYALAADMATPLPRFQAVVLDEAHLIRNEDARQTRAVLELALYAPYVIALTGTPVLNRVEELWSPLHLLRPDLYTDREDVRDKALNLKRFHRELEGTIWIRRRKADVLPDLPAVIRTRLPVELSNAGEYRLAHDDFERWLALVSVDLVDLLTRGRDEVPASILGLPGTLEEKVRYWHEVRARGLRRVAALRKLVGKGKVEGAQEWIEAFLASAEGRKLVVYAHHQEVREALFRPLRKVAVRLAPGTDYQTAVDRFQNDPTVRVAVASLRAASLGIPLTAADTMLFVELDWVPATLRQAEDRIHRIGQQASSVSYYYLVAPGTLDDRFLEVLAEKEGLMRVLLDS